MHVLKSVNLYRYKMKTVTFSLRHKLNKFYGATISEKSCDY